MTQSKLEKLKKAFQRWLWKWQYARQARLYHRYKMFEHFARTVSMRLKNESFAMQVIQVPANPHEDWWVLRDGQVVPVKSDRIAKVGLAKELYNS